ncbi:MAG TPA: beta-N-acetylhexosaminidase [Acidimicrobiales bacterium]|nr:beta-N-acetylhexosaminidase [Acidimicrobiales bacterium]
MPPSDHVTHPALLPRPRSVSWGSGVGARLADGLALGCEPGAGFEPVARWFRRQLEAATGWQVGLETSALVPGGAATIELRAGEVAVPGCGPSALGGVEETYRLEVGGGRVRVTAGAPAGAFYALQTLRQLLPDALYRSAALPPDPCPPIDVPEAVVEDGPRCRWRGVHLDVARHFMPLPFLLRLVDLAAVHKLNVLHLHLTDDQGWRVPVPAYPRLIEVGAWRRESPLNHWSEPPQGDGRPHGGFYQREDLEELVAYAAERHVTVLPEIDMPGHMAAAIAAYPELGNGRRPLEVRTRWGISSHVLNLEEETVRFCEEVLTEVAGIFPGTHLHIGGDECPTKEWEAPENRRAAQLMAEHSMSSPAELQGWFTARIAGHLRRLGRTLVGWDEILDAGAPEDAVVMSWRGEEGGIAAAAAGHDVVMAPQQWLYFDWAYEDSPAEPVAILAATSLERVYSYDPVASIPAEHRHHVLGLQAQLWTEYVSTPEHAEYLYFPRLCASAEVAWSPPERDFAEFEARLAAHLGRLRAMGVNYRPLSGPTPGQSRVWQGAEAAPAP